MIFFYCPECREELEAEDSIRNMKMKCPACWKEVTVPEVGVALAPGRRPSTSNRAEPGGGGLRIFIVTVVVVVFGVAAVLGYRHFRRQGPDAPKANCSACQGKARENCPECKGAKGTSCRGECQGSGRVIHQPSGEQTNCSDCGGSGRRICRVCDGAGVVSCRACARSNVMSCNACQGEGLRPCRTCHGRGCGKCTGGRMPCPECKRP